MNKYEFEIKNREKIIETKEVLAKNTFEAKGIITRIIGEGNYPPETKIGKLVSTTDTEILEYYEEIVDLTKRYK